MTPRERWLAVVTRGKPDRIPMTYRATQEATQKLMVHLRYDGMDAMFDRLHIDRPVGVGPAYSGPKFPADTDMYGRQYRSVAYPSGTYRENIAHPLAHYETIAEIEQHYTWPSPDWFDYSVIPKQIEGKDDRVIMGGGSEPFLLYKDLRGDEQAFIDLVLYPDIVHHCLDKLYDFCYENTRRIYERIPGKVMVTSVAEDMGSQDRLLYSRSHLEQFFFPRMQRMIDLAHEAGARVNTHSDGAIREILPDLIAMGVDILNPVQWRCAGMERDGLVRDFGDRLIFEGGVDNQYTLPYGTVEDVRREVRDNIRIFGPHYILGPCHNIQAVGPAENVVAMYDTGYEAGFID